MNQKEYLAEANKRFLKRQEDIAKGVRACEALQCVLQKLKVIDSRTYILVPDWGNYENYVYMAYKKRVFDKMGYTLVENKDEQK